MKNYIIKPDITFYPGIKVDKNTKLEYENENVKQRLESLKLKSTITENNLNYESKTDLTINLNEGDILIFDNKRGYILPSIPLVTVEEEIEELGYLKEV
jgi:hypothetical protein